MPPTHNPFYISLLILYFLVGLSRTSGVANKVYRRPPPNKFLPRRNESNTPNSHIGSRGLLRFGLDVWPPRSWAVEPPASRRCWASRGQQSAALYRDLSYLIGRNPVRHIGIFPVRHPVRHPGSQDYSGGGIVLRCTRHYLTKPTGD